MPTAIDGQHEFYKPSKAPVVDKILENKSKTILVKIGWVIFQPSTHTNMLDFCREYTKGSTLQLCLIIS